MVSLVFSSLCVTQLGDAKSLGFNLPPPLIMSPFVVIADTFTWHKGFSNAPTLYQVPVVFNKMFCIVQISALNTKTVMNV